MDDSERVLEGREAEGILSTRPHAALSVRPFAILAPRLGQSIAVCGTSPVDALDRTNFEYDDIASIVELRESAPMHPHNGLGECIPCIYRHGGRQHDKLKSAVARALVAGMGVTFAE